MGNAESSFDFGVGDGVAGVRVGVCVVAVLFAAFVILARNVTELTTVVATVGVAVGDIKPEADALEREGVSGVVA